MKKIDFKNAYYVKLGSGGKWEKSSFEEDILRIGWEEWNLEEINRGDWNNLKEKYKHQYKNKIVASTDVNALRKIVESTFDDIWITFSSSHLWWCKVGEQRIFQDAISNYRKVSDKWHKVDIKGNPLILSQIPGNIQKLQGYRGTICNVAEAETLKRLLNDESSPTFQAIIKTKEELVSKVKEGLTSLHWKDFETLVDLVFRNAGWRRTSVIGEVMKYVDLELEDPITGDLYQVQIKSSATLEEFEKYIQNFSRDNFRKFYFIVHSPDLKLSNYSVNTDENVELILPDKLAKMVVDFGLTDWLLKKIR
ncbi:MAG: hypothetical protein K9H48_16450 [Melioribacteraceae bacterium]|nr:hypothetical protein [Saprospiraceae bacterium]MCF8356043.1 hypothetical protein [Melioribacteraceae bacterium]MCF8395522.1 hypothetical protein [Melioribacteraceae bacterium]